MIFYFTYNQSGTGWNQRRGNALQAAGATITGGPRPLYETSLASAAVILALVVSGAEEETIQKEVQAHERLWGNTWLVDEAYKDPSNAWQKVKEAL